MSLSPRIELTYQQARVDSAGKTTDWMQIILLWRGQPGWQSNAGFTPAERIAAERQYNDARIAAYAANRAFFGGGGAHPYWAEIDRPGKRLYALGQEFVIPERGSALVVLLDRMDGVGGPPVVIGSAVVDGLLPSDVMPKTWTSGDTTFTVRPSRTALDVFLESLKQDPVVAAFLAESP